MALLAWPPAIAASAATGNLNLLRAAAAELPRVDLGVRVRAAPVSGLHHQTQL
jgi:hypothetical protein